METQRIVYNDKVVRQFIWASVLFGIVGMLVGIIIALQLAFWPANFPPYAVVRPAPRPSSHQRGHLRVRRQHAVRGRLLFDAAVVQGAARVTTCSVVEFHFWGWQLIIVSAAITLPLGITTRARSTPSSSGRSTSRSP